MKLSNRILIESLAILVVVGMQKLVSEMRIWFAKELFIEFLDLLVVMRLTYDLSLIFRIQCVCSLSLVGIDNVIVFVRQEARFYVRLAATVDTAARTAHDLNEMILGITFSDLVQKNFCRLHA